MIAEPWSLRASHAERIVQIWDLTPVVDILFYTVWTKYLKTIVLAAVKSQPGFPVERLKYPRRNYCRVSAAFTGCAIQISILNQA